MEPPSHVLERFNSLETNAKVAQQIHKFHLLASHRLANEWTVNMWLTGKGPLFSVGGGFDNDQWKSKVIAGFSLFGFIRICPAKVI